ncbi:MAG: hypothetical protein AMXMBFR57_32190 [Acidimicrobiia bacterium]
MLPGMPIDDEHTRLSDGSEEPTLLVNSEQATVLSPLSQSGRGPASAVVLTEGQAFGHYRIVRMLGRGGMGEVYEAEHQENGRRVALKLLRSRIGSGEDRERFLREGQLAASISDPHTVYVFGSEEIEGLPVIAMQLVPGGTLKDRVAAHGPMPVVEAVSAILDIISGLDAAAAGGILHRDIKPSNCFVDADGNVKVGDFGLSIPSSGRSAEGTFMGTPQFASPEQLRGDALDVRSDIYAVGATLHYLLTGAAPFEGTDFTTLIDRVKHAPPPLAHKVRSGIPAALGTLITRCLAKDAGDRPASYLELAAALKPFSTTGQPARLDVRVLAGAIDLLIISVPAGVLDAAFGVAQVQRGNTSADLDPWSVVFAVLYFMGCEGAWGATPGKRLLGLRVVSRTGTLTWGQAAARAVIYNGPTLVMQVPLLVFGASAVLEYLVTHPFVAAAGGLAQVVLTLLLFSTVRRKNGYAAVHDLVTGSRVVKRTARELRRRDAGQGEVPLTADTGADARRLGPFTVRGVLGTVEHGRLLDGVDAVLRRPVWLVEWDDGGPEVPRARRDVDRVGRLHWLAGRRAPGDNWDAFEAPQGLPFSRAALDARWPQVHGWLNDLAAELDTSDRDGTMPTLGTDRVWIRPDGRAVLLDWPAPDAAAGGEPLTPQQLLAQVGRSALASGHAASMPASAVAMLDRWQKKRQMSMAELTGDLALVTTAARVVTRTKRAGPLLLAASPVLLMMLAAVIAISQNDAVPHDRFITTELLEDLADDTDPARRQAGAVYLAGTYRSELVAADAPWRVDDDDDEDLARMRALAAEAAAMTPTPQQVADANAVLAASLTRLEARAGDQDNSTVIFIALLLVGAGMSLSGSLVSVMARPSGLVMSSLGFAVVTTDGREVSRARAVVRLLVAWSPLLIYGAFLWWPATRSAVATVSIAALAAAPVAAGFVWTALRPARGPHDLMVGTSVGTR